METSLSYFNVGTYEIILFLVLFLIPAIIWLWAITDLVRSEFSSGINKIVWAIVIIFIPFFGAILYFLIGRSQKVKSPHS